MTPEQELRELKEKIELFRKRIASYSNDLRLVNGWFNDLFPPPKPGAWCFWMDKLDSQRTRTLEAFSSQEEAEFYRGPYIGAGRNPSPVFFLPEEK